MFRHDLLVKQALATLVIEPGSGRTRHSGAHLGRSLSQSGAERHRVDNEQRLPALHLLTFAHVHRHYLALHLGAYLNVLPALNGCREELRHLGVGTLHHHGFPLFAAVIAVFSVLGGISFAAASHKNGGAKSRQQNKSLLHFHYFPFLFFPNTCASQVSSAIILRHNTCLPTAESMPTRLSPPQ